MVQLEKRENMVGKNSKKINQEVNDDGKQKWDHLGFYLGKYEIIVDI